MAAWHAQQVSVGADPSYQATMRFGKIGTVGSSHVRAADGSWAEAVLQSNMLIVRKLDEGYQEVTPLEPLRELTAEEREMLNNMRLLSMQVKRTMVAQVVPLASNGAPIGVRRMWSRFVPWASIEARALRTHDPIASIATTARARCTYALGWVWLLAATGVRQMQIHAK